MEPASKRRKLAAIAPSPRPADTHSHTLSSLNNHDRSVSASSLHNPLLNNSASNLYSTTLVNLTPNSRPIDPSLKPLLAISKMPP